MTQSYEAATQSSVFRIYTIGDSTMADKPLTDNPERGWGQMFRLFCGPNLTVLNRAENGRSTKTFLEGGLWQEVLDRLQPGDFVIIQFGHNDAKENSERYTDPFTTYKRNLEGYVTETRAKGATPILATPIHRRRFNGDGTFCDGHGDYPVACRQVADEMSVPLLEMHNLSEALIVCHGVEGSKSLFLHVRPGLYDKWPEGIEDDTHFGAYGASRMAELAVREMRRLDLPFAKFLKE